MVTGQFTSQAIAYSEGRIARGQIHQAGRPPFRSGRSGASRPRQRVARRLHVVDTGKQFEWVQYRHLENEGCSEEGLHATGLVNLARLASDSLQVVRHPNTEMFACLMGGNFEASLILLDDLWDRVLRQCVSGGTMR